MNIAVIGGDGTGPEVAAEGVKVLKAVAKLEGFDKDLKLTDLDWGGDRYLKTGEALPADGARPAAQVRLHPPRRRRPSRREAGHPRERLLLDLRFRLDQYINLRPVKLFPGVEMPAQGQGPGGHRLRRRPREHRGPVLRRRRLHEQGHAERSRHADGHLHPQGLRALRSARPSSSPRKRNNPKGKKLTLVAKTNVLTYGHDLWWRTFQEVGERVSRHREGLQPRRRLLHVDGQEPRVLRRDRHDEHVRRHHHRPLRASSRAAWASPPAATSTPTRAA